MESCFFSNFIVTIGQTHTDPVHPINQATNQSINQTINGITEKSTAENANYFSSTAFLAKGFRREVHLLQKERDISTLVVVQKCLSMRFNEEAIRTHPCFFHQASVLKKKKHKKYLDEITKKSLQFIKEFVATGYFAILAAAVPGKRP